MKQIIVDMTLTAMLYGCQYGAERRVLQWFGHMDRMDEEQLVKKRAYSEVRGVRLRGRPRMGWMESVKRALDVRGLSVEQGKITARDRNV